MNRMPIVVALLLAGASLALSQTEKTHPKPSQEKQVEQLPFPVGGVEAIQKILKYPESARKDSVQGVVYVEATVDREGKVISAVATKGVREDLDKAAVQAIKSITFKPGMHKGKPVEAIVTIPISFKLK